MLLFLLETSLWFISVFWIYSQGHMPMLMSDMAIYCNETIKDLNERLLASENLVKQHTKVAEEAISGSCAAFINSSWYITCHFYLDKILCFPSRLQSHHIILFCTFWEDRGFGFNTIHHKYHMPFLSDTILGFPSHLYSYHIILFCTFWEDCGLDSIWHF